MAFTYMKDFDPKTEYVEYRDRTIEDQWIANELNGLIAEATESLDSFDYATARASIDRFFYMTYCDNYLEMIKPRFQEGSGWTCQEVKSAQSTLYDSTRTIIGLFAPYMPFITEELYQRAFRVFENDVSLHQSSWPKPVPGFEFEREAEMEMILWVLSETRKIRSERKLGAGTPLDKLVIELDSQNDADMAESLKKSLMAATRSENIVINKGSLKTIADMVASDKKGQSPKAATDAA